MAAEVGDRNSFEQTNLIERVKSLERSLREMQRDQKSREEWSSQQLHSLEKQLSLSALACPLPSSPSGTSMAVRSPRLAYSSSFKKPDVPSTFQMPLHYPKYTKDEYERMPEWKLDRLLEEYGLPVLGSVREKRQYAIGVFLWGKSDQ